MVQWGLNLRKRRYAHAACLFALAPLSTSAQVNMSFLVDTTKASATLPNQFLSFNIDTGSLYNELDFSNPILVNLLQQLSPGSSGTNTFLRVGGGAADSTLYTGPNGASGAGSAPWNNTVLVNQTYFDELVNFASSGYASLVWDLNGRLRDGNNAWDPTVNATALFEHVAASGLGSKIAAWQLGNEPTLWKGTTVTGTQLAHDYIKLKDTLKQYPSLSQIVYGPDGCCGDDKFLAEFLPIVHAAGALDYLSEHYYPITPNPKACTLDNYLNKTYYAQTMKIMDGYQSLIDQYAPGMPLVLGETATTNMGGCDGLSASFAAGFYYVYILGEASNNGIAQVNRQDLVGWSSATEPSQYMLAGVPGWTNAASGTLYPHPDWFTSVLYKQITQFYAFNVSINSVSSPSYSKNLAIHAYCGMPWNSAQKGALAISYINTGNESVTLNLQNPDFQAAPRYEWVLTSQSSSSSSSATFNDPPSSLAGNDMYLNGELMSVDPSTGLLPQRLIPGRDVTDPWQPLVLPPYSYGFVTFYDATVGACS